jgi:iron complex outermembrane receptor protein
VKKNEIAARLRCGAAPVILAAALITPALAIAQDTPQEAQEAGVGDNVIIVTGSRIARPDLAASSPVSVVTSDQLQLASKAGVEEFLRNMPQAVSGLGSNNNNGNEGTATVNLRNLGEERTLVLVDGKRFVPYDSQGIVDLNMIPASLVERVEVVTGGASAVYGSDAVAGVVNFIMKKDFQGIAGDAQYGLSEKGDGRHYDFSLTGGLNLGDRGNIVVNGTYSKQQKVTQGAREFSKFSLASADFSPGGSSTNEFGSIDLPGGLGRYTFTPNGFVPYSGARDSFNFNPFNLLQVPQEKYTATALLHYDVTDSVEFFGRASYGKTKIRTEIAPSGTFGFTFDVNYLTNPFFDPAINPAAANARAIFASQDTDGDGILTVGVRRRTTEVGPRISSYENQAWQTVGGLRGDLSSAIKWEVFAQYGKTKRNIGYLNDLDANKVQQAILATSTTACTDPTGGCVPANLFGFGNLSAAAAKFIAFDLSEVDKNSQFVAGGFLNGDLPFGLVTDRPAAFVAGVEYRKEKATANPDANLRVGNSIGFGASSPIDAQIEVKEAYGELKVPILGDIPFAKSLTLEAGVRYSDYSNKTTVDATGSGGTISHSSNGFTNWTYKIGGDWEPVDSLRFRAMYQRAVRAPNLNEIGLPITPGTGDATFDPCDSNTFDPTDTTLDTLCRTVGGGLPSGVAPGTIAPPTSGQVNNFSGGNPALIPEKADTITLGAVFKPTFLRGFTATIDFFDIKVKKAILATPEQAILDACYYAERNANGTFCSLIKRSQIDGSLEGSLIYGVDATNRNIGKKTSRGIDFTFDYNREIVPNVKLGLNLQATYVMDSKVGSKEKGRPFGERVLQIFLHRALQRPRAIDRIVADPAQPALAASVRSSVILRSFSSFCHAADLDVDDRPMCSWPRRWNRMISSSRLRNSGRKCARTTPSPAARPSRHPRPRPDWRYTGCRGCWSG